MNLVFENISKAYKETVALSKINLSMSNGVYGLLAFVGGSAWNYAAVVITVLVSVVTTFIIGMMLKIDDSEM